MNRGVGQRPATVVMRRRVVVLVLSCMSAGIGCGLVDPLPREAVAGTTISLAYGFGISTVGYEPQSSHLPILDVQRGQLALALCPADASGNGIVDSDGLCPAGEVPLPIRLITRIGPAPSSRMNLGRSSQQPIVQIIGGETSQPVVLVDLPLESEGIWEIFQPGAARGQIQPRRRMISIRPAMTDGAGQPMAQYSDLTVLTTSLLTPASYNDIIPLPQLNLVLNDPSQAPSAAEVIVSYPAALVAPVAALQPTNLAPDTYASITTAGLPPGQVKILLAVPSPGAAGRATSLNLVFELVGEDPTPVTIADFAIEPNEAVLYDESGAEITRDGYSIARIY